MALFGLGNKKIEKTLNKVRPTVVRTQNVAHELAKVAKFYNVKVDLLDFTILGVQSYTRFNTKEKEGEWSEVDNAALHTVDESHLLDAYFEIKQTYEIEIFSKTTTSGNTFCDNFITSVGANATKCKIYLSVKENSEVKFFPRFEVEFENTLQKKKVRAGILINIFDEMVGEMVSKLSADLKVNGKIIFPTTQTYLIAQGYEPTPTRHDALIFHYEKKEELNEHTKVDYASRGFIQSVKEGEVLIEYVKPKAGKAGRNCRGEYIKPEEPKILNEVTFNVDTTIKIVETPDSIEYIALQNGYIAFEDNTYTVKKEMDVSEVSFKTTGSIRSGLDSDVSMNVQERDAIKDAVGKGMVVEVSEIDIDGNVGSHAKVIANKVKVGGQTHKTAYIEAQDVDINIHKGSTKGKKIHITRLEHGYIDGEDVVVLQALGGTIKGKEVKIDICGSHVKVVASDIIEIKRMQGSENSFIIDPLLQDELQTNLQTNKEKIKKLEKEIARLEKNIEDYMQQVKDGRGAFLEIKRRLTHYKQKGIKLPNSFVKKYKQFQEIQEKLKMYKKNRKDTKEELSHWISKISSFQGTILQARVINRDRWVGYNEIKFRLIDPPMELVYRPAEGSEDKIFGLVEVDDGEFVIQPMKEEE